MSKFKLVTILIIIVFIIYFGFATDFFRFKNVSDFNSCIAYGYPVMESYPRQCRDSNGVTYVEIIATTTPGTTTSTTESDIRVDLPISGSVVSSPISIKGEAKGRWFFEGSFPVSLTDENGGVLVNSHATAKSDWMSEDFVPFDASIAFSVVTSTPGFIVFKNDNPSGDASRDTSFKIPVILVKKIMNTK